MIKWEGYKGWLSKGMLTWAHLLNCSPHCTRVYLSDLQISRTAHIFRHHDWTRTIYRWDREWHPDAVHDRPFRQDGLHGVVPQGWKYKVLVFISNITNLIGVVGYVWSGLSVLVCLSSLSNCSPTQSKPTQLTNMYNLLTNILTSQTTITTNNHNLLPTNQVTKTTANQPQQSSRICLVYQCSTLNSTIVSPLNIFY